MDETPAPSPGTDAHELGIRFARTCLTDPTTPTAGLSAHPLSSAYRSCHDTLMFLCGRQAGRIELGDDETYLFLKGFLARLSDEGRRRSDDPN